MNQTYNPNNLPAVAGQLANPDVLKNFLVPDKEAKIRLQMNWLCLQARDNPELEAGDFINFVRTVQKTGADPERKQIHLVTYKRKIKVFDQLQNRMVEKWVTKGEPIFSYHYFVARAQETGELALMEVNTETCDYNNPATGQMIKNTICAVATVVRRDKTGKENKYVYRAYFPEFVKLKDEYVNGNKTGKQQATEAWATKPYLMLEKCAVANALRWGFEAELAGMYIPEEMHGEFSQAPAAQPEPRTVNAEVVDTTQNVDPTPSPAAEDESQLDASMDVQDDDQPLDGFEGEETPEETQETPGQAAQDATGAAQDATATDSGPIAARRTKGLLWSKIQHAHDAGQLDKDAAAKKLETVHLTEALAQKLIAELHNGNPQWFVGQ